MAYLLPNRYKVAHGEDGRREKLTRGAGERREKEDDCEFEAIGVVKIEPKHWTCINVVFTITNQLVVIVNRKQWHHTCHVYIKDLLSKK